MSSNNLFLFGLPMNWSSYFVFSEALKGTILLILIFVVTRQPVFVGNHYSLFCSMFCLHPPKKKAGSPFLNTPHVATINVRKQVRGKVLPIGIFLTSS